MRYVKFDDNGWGIGFDKNPHSDKATEALKNNFATDKDNPELLKLDSLNRVTLKTQEQRDIYDAEQIDISIQSEADSMTECTKLELADAMELLGMENQFKEFKLKKRFDYTNRILFSDKDVKPEIEAMPVEIFNAIKIQIIKTKRGI